MRTIRKASERGHANHGWLDSHHTFSFASYHDPRHMGFGPLRVINDDVVAGGGGFPPHAHRDMEIISYVIEGALAHDDDMGNGSVMKPGDVQRMSAGRGVTHAEYNASKTEPVHFLQIWITPERGATQSGYEQKFFADDEKHNTLRLVASRDGADGSITIQQDAKLYASIVDKSSITHTLAPRRKAWLHVVKGNVELDGTKLEAGDGVAISDETALSIASNDRGEVLLFDLPA